MLYFLLIIIVIAVLDLITLFNKKRKFSKLIYKTSNPLLVFQACIVTLLILIGIFYISLYLNAHLYSNLYLFLISIILAEQLGTHTFLENGIAEKGVAIWGQYFNWSEIKSYEVKGNNLIFRVNINLSGLKYQVIERCRVKQKELADVEKYISEHI